MSLRVRIGVLLFAGVFCAGLGLYVLLVNLTRQRLTQELDTRLQSYTSLLATRLSTPLLLEDHAGMKTELRRALRENGMIGVVVYDPHGVEFERLVRDGARWIPNLDPPSKGPSATSSRNGALLARARARLASAAIVREPLHRADLVDEARELYGLDARPVPVGEARLGWVRTVYATDSVEQVVSSAARMGLTVLFTALALWLVPLFGLLRFITEPLREASDLARAIAQGELERRIPVRSPDELGTLATSLNTMAAALTQAREQTRIEADAMRRATEAVVSIARGAREVVGVDAVFDVVASQLRFLTESHGAALALPDASQDMSRLQRFDPPLPWGDLAPGQPMDAELLRRMQAGPGPVLLDIDRENLPLAHALRRDGFRRALVVPLREEEGCRSSILLVSTREDAFPHAQIEVVVGLASHLASAIQAAMLRSRLESAVDELVRTRERLEHSERMRLAGEMASGVAHDFNNVLGAILGRAQLLRRQAEAGELPAPALARALEVIERAAMDGGDTVRRLRQFGPGGRAPDAEIVDLDEALRGAAEYTRTRWENEAQALGRRISVEIRSEPGATVEGRGSEMREIFTNLILNSIDALPGGGTIVLATRIQGDLIIADVEDDGVGIPATIRKRIFDPFFTTKGERGTGLGLSVVYGIVQGAGGSINVASTPGLGTRVTIELPRALPGVAVYLAPPPPRDEGEALRVMVVDDEPAVRELLRDILASLGHRPEIFASGGEALERYAPGAYDLVFTDLGMPGMTGWELSRAIRARDPDVTIAMITGWGAEVGPDALAAAGGDAVVSKPFTIEDVEGLTRLARERSRRAA
ncbi:MAG: response regulator [Candidatus Eisenbacteria bacterium]